MKQDYNPKWMIYFITLTLAGLLLVFSYYIKEKRRVLDVSENAVFNYFENSHFPVYPFEADSNIVFSYLEGKSIKLSPDSLIYKKYFGVNGSNVNKINKFAALLNSVYSQFSRTLVSINSCSDYYEMVISVNASEKHILYFYIDQKTHKIKRVSGLDGVIDLFCISFKEKANFR